MSLQERLEERIVSFVIGIAVATLGLYLVLIQLLGLSVVRREDYVLRSDVAANYVRKDEVNCRGAEPSNSQVHGRPVRPPATETRKSPEAALQNAYPLGAGTPNNGSVTPEPSQGPMQPGPVLRHIAPASGAESGYMLTIEHCGREGDIVACWGFASNNSDAPDSLYLEDSHAVDDQGNSMFVGLFGGGISFDTGNSEKLIPGVPVRFHVRVRDAHTAVRSLVLQLNTQWQRSYDHLIFKDVPVE
jgi:hypothetical protein